MQVVWDKTEYAGGEIHLPLSNKNYSYVLPLLLFHTLNLHDFRTTTRSSTRSKHRAQTCKADKQEQLRQYINQEKALQKEQGLAQGQRTQKHSGLSGDLDHITQGYVLGIF
jgi:hypothetical protein